MNKFTEEEKEGLKETIELRKLLEFFYYAGAKNEISFKQLYSDFMQKSFKQQIKEIEEN
jgi:hypothetical protein